MSERGDVSDLSIISNYISESQPGSSILALDRIDNYLLDISFLYPSPPPLPPPTPLPTWVLLLLFLFLFLPRSSILAMEWTGMPTETTETEGG